MINPGAKGWINKYLHLIEKGEIVLELPQRPILMKKMQFMHLIFAKTGIVYGYPLSFLFYKDIDTEHWTMDEKMRFLLFECHIFTFLIQEENIFSKEKFIDKLYDFYGCHNGYSVPKLIQKFIKEHTKEHRLEKILANRTDISQRPLHKKVWISAMSNTFSFLDVLLFDEYIFHGERKALSNYESYAKNTMISVILSANSDGVIQKSESSLFTIFLRSSDLSNRTKKELKDSLLNGAGFHDFDSVHLDNWLLKRFILDVAILTVISNHEIEETESQLLLKLCHFLSISKSEFEDSLSYAESFLFITEHEIQSFLNSSSYSKIVHSLSKKWSKILHRNKSKIVQEITESKELVHLLRKSKKEKLTSDEKYIVKSQMNDILKTFPALVIFMIPGGSLLLPILLKILPDFLPSSFKSNQIDSRK